MIQKGKNKTKRNRYDSVHYTVGIKHDEELLIPIKETRRIRTDNVKRYHGVTPLTLQLDAASRCLLDYLAETMTEENYVRNSKFNRAKFNTFIQLNGGKGYSDDTIKAAFRKLSALGLLRTVEKGLHQVHPEYFYKGSDTDRYRLLVKIFSADSHKKAKSMRKESIPKQDLIRSL